MAFTFDRTRDRRIHWRRELAPVLAVAGLAADYLSPPAFWTILLPLGGIVLLLALRRPAVAAVVFLLSSWVLVPLAARATLAVEELRGEPSLLITTIADPTQPSLSDAVVDRCAPGDVGFETLPVGPGYLINPRWVLRDTIVSFAELHNQMLIASWHQDPDAACTTTAPAQ
jgi:hypothetical protein